jgi:hypothetical protein
LRDKTNLTRQEYGLRLDGAPYLDRCIAHVMEYLATLPQDLQEYADTLQRKD